MDFSRIDITQRKKIENIRLRFKHTLLSHSFSALYLWQDTLGLSMYCEEDFFVVRCQCKGDNSFYFPCGNDEKKFKFIKEHLNDENLRFCYMRKEDVEFLKNSFPGRFNIQANRASYEYIYDRSEQLSTSGKRFAHIRNEVNKLKREHKLETKMLDKDSKVYAVEIINAWKERTQADKTLGFDDYGMALNALDVLNELDMQGVLVYVDDKPEALVVGCEIYSDTYSVEIAKLKTKMNGLLNYSLQELYKRLPEKYTFINGDDDMGLLGIRTQKERAQPCRLTYIWEGEIIK